MYKAVATLSVQGESSEFGCGFAVVVATVLECFVDFGTGSRLDAPGRLGGKRPAGRNPGPGYVAHVHT